MRTLRTVDYRSSAVSSSASLSKAIRDRRYHELPELLGEAVLSERGPRNDRERTRAAKTDAKTDTAAAAATETAATTTTTPNPQTGNPLWEANSRGWTPMHVAATGCTEMPLKWWRWILRVQRIAPERERERSTTGKAEAPPVHRPCELWKRHTDTGQTVLDLFFRAALHPAPWFKRSRRETSFRLRTAIERLLVKDGRSGLSALRKLVVAGAKAPEAETSQSRGRDPPHAQGQGRGDAPRTAGTGDDDDENDDNENENDDESVLLVLGFWRKLEALLSACAEAEPHRGPPATGKENDENDHRRWQGAFASLALSDRPPPVAKCVRLLATLPFCPELVGRLALALFPQGESPCSRSRSPPVPLLHAWIRSRQGPPPPRADPGILPVLCSTHEGSAGLPDLALGGRLPLHSAVALGCPWEGAARPIFGAFPAAAGLPDPSTGLPAFCLGGLPARSQEHQRWSSSSSASASSSWYASASDAWRGGALCVRRIDRDRALEAEAAESERSRLTTAYEVLRRNPSVLEAAVVRGDVRRKQKQQGHPREGLGAAQET
ncbi:unnamed protein product [Pseudo-nitzschia multistriata]|uniref:Uncharacterized protein n=1 Tax=Pseudo-nitzschia multistriata TaxID=183589 RepID=A0A448Z088_9STRA|nr:unnamed protein product [Pseudo-nitzschia multistriata]